MLTRCCLRKPASARPKEYLLITDTHSQLRSESLERAPVSARAQGYAFPHLTRRLDIAGRHVTAHLTELLRRRGNAAAAAASTDAMRQLKERLCYVAADLACEQKVGLRSLRKAKAFKALS